MSFAISSRDIINDRDHNINFITFSHKNCNNEQIAKLTTDLFVLLKGYKTQEKNIREFWY